MRLRQRTRDLCADGAILVIRDYGRPCRHEPGCECGRAVGIEKPLHGLNELVPTLRREVVVRSVEAGEVTLLKAQGRDYGFLEGGRGRFVGRILCCQLATESGDSQRG